MVYVKRCWCGGGVQEQELFDYLGRAIKSVIVCVDSRFHDPLADGRPVKIKRLYVAGPMSGYPQCNYPAFNSAAQALRRAGYEVVNPAEVHLEERHHYVDLIREDLRLMLDCHGVATLENWWESVGARNEVQVAGILKMPIRSVLDWTSGLYSLSE